MPYDFRPTASEIVEDHPKLAGSPVGVNMLSRRELLIVAGALAAAFCGGARSAADVQTPSSDKLATVTLAVTGMT